MKSATQFYSKLRRVSWSLTSLLLGGHALTHLPGKRRKLSQPGFYHHRTWKEHNPISQNREKQKKKTHTHPQLYIFSPAKLFPCAHKFWTLGNLLKKKKPNKQKTTNTCGLIPGLSAVEETKWPTEWRNWLCRTGMQIMRLVFTGHMKCYICREKNRSGGKSISLFSECNPGMLAKHCTPHLP